MTANKEKSSMRVSTFNGKTHFGRTSRFVGKIVTDCSGRTTDGWVEDDDAAITCLSCARKIEQRELANGVLVEVEPSGRAVLARCPWMIEVASGNPEPDSYADTIKIVDCGSKLRADHQYGDDTIVCEAGHVFGGAERRLAPAGDEWLREQHARYEETGAVL